MSHQRRSSRSYHSKRTSIDLSSILTTPINTKDILDQVPTSVRRLASPTSPLSQDDNTPDRLADLLARSASLHGGYPLSPSSTHSRRQSLGPIQDAYEGSTRVLDVASFPSTWKTQDIRNLFSAYIHQMGGFKIKWLDDQRALIIFEHPSIARKAYLDQLAKNSQIKVKPYDGPMDVLIEHSPISPRAPTLVTSTSTTLGKRRQSRDISHRDTSFNNSPLSPTSTVFTPASIQE